MQLFATLKQRVGKVLLERSMRNGIDLRKLKYLPDSVTMPLQRTGVDPLPELGELRATDPVHELASMFGKRIWLVSGYDVSRAVLADASSYSNDLGQFVSQEGREAKDQIGGLGMTDPPNHTELRRLLTPEFTMRKLARLEPQIEGIVSARLDVMEQAGPEVDLVKEFAFPVPFEVICELLGLPVDDRERFHDLGVARFDLSAGGAGAFGAAGHTRDFLIQAVNKQRQDPGPGLIGGLLAEHPDVDDVTLGGLADGVFLGGYETSASMLALGALLIADNPDAIAALQEGPEAVDRVVEELLRHLTVVQIAFLRFARADHELAGHQIREGDVVAVSLLGANRDVELAPGAEQFDPRRASTRHLAFGHGMHRCVGAELARMELRIALRQLAARFPRMTVTAATGDLDFRKLSAVYGVDSLPVRLDGRVAQPA